MQPNKRRFLAIRVIVILIFTGLYFIINQQTPLPGYVGDTSSITSTLENEDTIGEMETYQDPDTGFSISIPIDWQQVTMDGYQTFIHSASASSIQIQVQDYYPQVNMVTDVYSHILDDDRKKNAELFEDAFYGKKISFKVCRLPKAFYTF